MAGTVRLYVTSTLANYLHRSPSPACLQRWHVWIGWSVRSSGSLAGLLPCFLPMCISPVLPFSLFSRKRRLSLLAYRTFVFALSAPLSLSLPFPSVSFSCVLLSHRSSISVVGSLCLLCIWVVGIRYRRRRRRRRRRKRGRVKKKK